MTTNYGAMVSTRVCLKTSLMIDFLWLLSTIAWHYGHFIEGFLPLNPFMYVNIQTWQKVWPQSTIVCANLKSP